MKIICYIQYFFYLGINWGWRLALIIIRQEIKGEKKYGINTTGADELKSLKKNGIDISHATIYMPVTYLLIENTLSKIKQKNKLHFLDIGCGKGRALCVAAHHGFNKLTGVDFAEKLCIEANENLHITKQYLPAISFTILNQDAVDTSIPDDVDCIFLFNPFDEVVMEKVLRNILQSVQSVPRALEIIYANPLHKKIFMDNNFEETYYSKTFQYFEVAVLSYRH